MEAPARIAQLDLAAHDPLDLHMQRLGVARASGWTKVSSQTTLLLLTGIVLGPVGLAFLTPGVLAVLQPAVPVALAVLGVTAAFGPAERHTVTRRAIPLVSALILLAGLSIALRPPPVTAALAAAQASAIAILLAGAGWLLSSHGANEEQRRMFSIATFLLLGGVADYLSLSGVLLGWVAVSAWRIVRAPVLAGARLDAAYVQHPMTALLLVIVGAHVQFSWPIAFTASATVALAIVLAPGAGHARLGTEGILRSISLTPSAAVIALAMDLSRLDSRLTALLSVVVLSVLSLVAVGAVRSRGGA